MYFYPNHMLQKSGTIFLYPFHIIVNHAVMSYADYVFF